MMVWRDNLRAANLRAIMAERRSDAGRNSRTADCRTMPETRAT
jgi:hypothetical protein